ncbi:uncharacterized protein [Ptychodera flava]|uniref:uncharacterized protein n=1 Tax=Ptychodera flava TaxID=63121 RepID=UPI00396A723E
MASNQVVPGGTTNEVIIGGFRFGRDCRDGPFLYVRRYPVTIILLGFVLFGVGVVVMMILYNYSLIIAGAVLVFTGTFMYIRAASRARLSAGANTHYINRVNSVGVVRTQFNANTGTTVLNAPETMHHTSVQGYPQPEQQIHQTTPTAPPLETADPSGLYGFQPAAYTYSPAAGTDTDRPDDAPPSYDSVMSSQGHSFDYTGSNKPKPY